MGDLAQRDGLLLVRATASETSAGLWGVTAYADDNLVDDLANEGFDVVVIKGPAELQAQWDNVALQTETGEV
jgi:hypothetical protein